MTFSFPAGHQDGGELLFISDKRTGMLYLAGQRLLVRRRKRIAPSSPRMDENGGRESWSTFRHIKMPFLVRF